MMDPHFCHTPTEYHNSQARSFPFVGMIIRRVRVEEEAMRRYVEECWLPMNRDLEAVVSAHALDVGEEFDREVSFHMELFDDPDRRIWVALDDVEDPTAPLAEIDATFAGHVTTVLEPSPEPFDVPDRLVVGDLWVRSSYRGTGVADKLIERAGREARESGCAELALDVDVDNERALAFYDRLGFEPARYRMRLPVDAL